MYRHFYFTTHFVLQKLAHGRIEVWDIYKCQLFRH